MHANRYLKLTMRDWQNEMQHEKKQLRPYDYMFPGRCGKNKQVHRKENQPQDAEEN